MAPRNTAYQLITDRILTLLDRGVVPWHQPWAGGWPMNLVSGRPYRGINVMLLGCQSYTSPYWLSFPKQVNDRGGRLRTGERVTYVVFWKPWAVPRQDEDNGQGEREAVTRHIPVLRWYKVVNVEQCTGIAVPPLPAHPAIQPIAACERIVAEMPNPPVIEHVRPQACYTPTQDVLNMPPRSLFESADAYYSTLFHELTHSTGHESRLNRKTLMDLCPFGSTNYSKEELVAEMGAAFLGGQTGITTTTIEASAAYIKAWLTRLRNDVTLVVQAAAQAQKAVDYIVGRPPHTEEA
jgi:antirestriction protein ArdC